ncbi:hypothetical protein Tco_1420321 [Tanacetum coccineum]
MVSLVLRHRKLINGLAWGFVSKTLLSRDLLLFVELYFGDIVSRNVLTLYIPSPFVIGLTLWSLLLSPGAVPTGTTLSNSSANRATTSMWGHPVGASEEGGSSAEHQFVPKWGLRDDLQNSSVHACKEMITHLATPAKDEYLGSLSSVDEHVRLLHWCDVQLEELNRLRNNLQKEMQANSELSKQFTLLDSAHSSCEDKERELMDQLKDMDKERDDWRGTASRQVKRIRVLEGKLGSKSQQLNVAEERVRALEGDNNKLVSHLAQAEMERHKLVREFISDVVRKLLASSEYKKSMAVPIGMCFTIGWLGGKVVESYRLLMDQLLQVSPDLPSPVDASTRPSTEVNVGNVSAQVPPDTHTAEATSEPPFKHAL